MHIFTNILRNKGNQTMKFGQLIEYNTRNIFLEKSYRECGGETGPRLFFEKLKLSISLDPWNYNTNRKNMKNKWSTSYVKHF